VNDMQPMTCREFDEVVHGYVRMELLDVRLREAALEHTALCPKCAGRMAEAIALADATAVTTARVRDLQTPAGVGTAVLAEFRSHRRRVSLRRAFQWSSGGAAAAVLVLAIWTIGVRSRGQPPSSGRKDISSQSRAPLDARGSGSLSGNDSMNGTGQSETAQATGAAQPAVTYAAADFVPVPFAGAITSDDPGMVVRVQLTRASLAQLGYPVAETPDDDLIRADVLLGEDGWPRGVKLVQ